MHFLPQEPPEQSLVPPFEQQQSQQLKVPAVKHPTHHDSFQQFMEPELPQLPEAYGWRVADEEHCPDEQQPEPQSGEGPHAPPAQVPVAPARPVNLVKDPPSPSPAARPAPPKIVSTRRRLIRVAIHSVSWTSRGWRRGPFVEAGLGGP